MSDASSAEPPTVANRRQTTVLVGGSNGTAALCAILGDRSNPRNVNHVIRVVTRSPQRFASSDGEPRTWRCNEQKPFTDLVPLPIFPTHWMTHVGAPDSVFAYTDDDGDGNDDSGEDNNGNYNDNSEGGRASNGNCCDDAFERAISGIGAPDDGGVADIIVLCCPVYAHLPILRRIAMALYKLDARDALLSSPSAPPLLIGTLYAAGGFDWMSRLAFASEKPPVAFSGGWKRELALFGLKAFPYLCKSTEPGVVNMYGRYPQLRVAICPSTPRVRAAAKTVLERVLQSDDTGKHVDFLGISSSEHNGGDGSAPLVDAAATAAVMSEVHNVLTNSKHSKTGAKVSMASSLKSLSIHGAQPSSIPPPLPSITTSMSMADHADPFSTMGFLACTLNATNQILHPCIISALFHDETNPSQSDQDGSIPWDYPAKHKTPLPRFYADGAARPEAGRLITAIAGAELYPLMDCLDVVLAPRGMLPISSQHGGEPVGRFVCNNTGNSPQDVAHRSGLTDMVLRKQQHLSWGAGHGDLDNAYDEIGGDEEEDNDDAPVPGAVPHDRRMNYRRIFEKIMSNGLVYNTRLGSVLSPAIPLKDKDGKDLKRIKPNVRTRFFIDDVPHGLCVQLGLGEMLGFNLERDMPEVLGVVRRLQHWMGKEYVLPAGKESNAGIDSKTYTSRKRKKRIVGDARDLCETSAPQAFGVHTIQDLRDFLRMSPFGEDVQLRMEQHVNSSPLVVQIQSKL